MKADLASGPWCHYCRAPAPTKDHVVPRALGGTDAKVNIVPACVSCNSRKGHDWPDVEHRGDGFTCGTCAEAIRYFDRLAALRGETREQAAERAAERAQNRRDNAAQHAAAQARKRLAEQSRRAPMTSTVGDSVDSVDSRDPSWNHPPAAAKADSASPFFQQLRQQNSLADGPYHHG